MDEATNDKYRYLSVLHDNPGRPAKLGDIISTYELTEPWPYVDLPPHSGHSPDLPEYQREVIESQTESDWRMRDVLRCTCRRQIAQILFHVPSELLWVVLTSPEWVPPQHRDNEDGQIRGWVLHGLIGEAPCEPDFATCPGCDARWLIASFADHAELIAVRRATHRRVIVE